MRNTVKTVQRLDDAAKRGKSVAFAIMPLTKDSDNERRRQQSFKDPNLGFSEAELLSNTKKSRREIPWRGFSGVRH